jgi:hypothetical protein
MLERLGNVLFWLGLIIAAGWLILSYFGLSTRPNPTSFDLGDFLTVAVIPALSISIGWALRYILAGAK